MEVWKEVDGYEGLYEVSNLGRVLSLPRLKYGKFITGSSRQIYKTKERLLSPKVDKDGYLSVTLTDQDGNRSMRRVHRLVAIAFLEKPEGKDVVHHKDENVKNNCADNLAWVTTKENLLVSDVFGKLSNKFSKPIICKTTEGKIIGRFKSVTSAANKLAIDPRHISSVLNGRRKQTRGYIFEWEVVL